MYDGMNPQETLEVLKIREQIQHLNYTQTYSLAKSLLEDLHRGIHYLSEEIKELKRECEFTIYVLQLPIQIKFQKKIYIFFGTSIHGVFQEMDMLLPLFIIVHFVG